MSETNSSSNSAPTPVPRPWEMQEGESAKAFAAFRGYRDLGAGRTLIAAYRTETGRKAAVEPTGQWREWYAVGDWENRARAYDAHLDSIAREKAEDLLTERIEEHQDRQRKIAVAATEASVNLLKIANKRLAALAKLDEAQLAAEIPVKLIPFLLRAAAQNAQAAAQSEASALAIDELLDSLDDQSSEENPQEAA